MRHPGRFGQGVNAYTGDAALAHEAGGGLENSVAVFSRLFLGNAHAADLKPERGLDKYNYDRHLN